MEKNIELKKNLWVTLLNSETQDAKNKIRKYNLSKYTDNIYSKYNRPSKDKIESFNKIKEECKNFDGYALKITGGNLYYYSCAYKLKINNDIYLIYHTVCNRFAIKLGE